MTSIEIATTLASIFALWIGCFSDKAIYRWAAAILVISALLLYVHHESFRLGMIGTYTAAGMALAFLPTGSLLSRRYVPLYFCSGLLAALATICHSKILPPLLQPSPTGQYMVGRKQLDPAEFALSEAAYRTPAVELWYPVDPKTSWAPSFYARHYMREGHSSAPIADAGARFPLIIYFSGGSGTALDGINIIRELVSNGFVVASLYYPIVLRGLDKEASEKREADFGRDIFQFSSNDDFQSAIKPLDKRVRERAGDAGLLLDHIRSNATDSEIVQIRAHLAPNVAGVMGFSFGGSIAAEAKVLDDRFTAALNLDGWHFGASVNGVPRPYLLVASQEAIDFYTSVKSGPQPPDSHDAELTRRDFEVTIPSLQQSGAYLLSVTGTNHGNLADGAFSGSLFRHSQGLGTLNKYRAYEIIAKISVTYFDAHLRRDTSIVAGQFQRHYPEIKHLGISGGSDL